MFINISSKTEFFQITNAFNKSNHGNGISFLYDCGSSLSFTSLKHVDYTTRKFKSGLSLPPLLQTSTVVGVYCDECLIDFIEKKPFSLSSINKMSFERTDFYNWMKSSMDSISGYMELDIDEYLSVNGFDSIFHSFDINERKILSEIYEHYNNLKPKELRSDRDENFECDRLGHLGAVLEELALLDPIGNKLILPKVNLKHYKQIKNMLEKAGGKYKKNSFDFGKKDAKEVKERLLLGEVINNKKKYQQFYTPVKLAMVAIKWLDLKPGETWAEPSAGTLKLAKLAEQISPGAGILVEIDPELCAGIKEQGFDVINSDYLVTTIPEVDKILANPPFSNPLDSDIRHVMKMYDDLKDGGSLVSFMGTRYLRPINQIQKDFITFLKERGAEIKRLPNGMFNESGTSVPTTMVKITKPTKHLASVLL